MRKAYGDVVAVDGVDLEIRRGEFFTMLGPSGSGKTTCLRMIAGFERPDEGRIELAGEDVTDIPPDERDVNTVFQDYALFPHMSRGPRTSAYGLRVKKVAAAERAQRVEEALAMVRLEGYGDRRPGQLSGGQRQRVALARALVNRPRALLLDEPLGALDLKLRQQLQVELKRIQQEVGITFIYVTHDQDEALTMSDRIAVMDGGRVLQIGAPQRGLRRARLAVRRRLRRRLERARAGGRARRERRARRCGSAAGRRSAPTSTQRAARAPRRVVTIRPERIASSESSAGAVTRRGLPRVRNGPRRASTPGRQHASSSSWTAAAS